MSAVTFRDIDRDDALGEAVERLYGCTRAGLLRRAAFGGAAAVLATLARPAASPAAVSDVDVLRFGLRFEQLQATFYTQAEEIGTIGAMPPAERRWAQTLGAHERAHVKIIKEVLGPKAEPAPAFDFGEANETPRAFIRTAVAMEDLTVALLGGVTPGVHDRGLTAALLGLLTVEARHAAWARHIAGADPAPRTEDAPMAIAAVQAAVDKTNFVVERPRMRGRSSPPFTG
ncbi:MAG: ferritin-like domain-containing protein [Solirubrobacteraceae bacterium]